MDKEILFSIIILVVFFFGGLGFWVLQSSIEKNAYNRLTGGDVTLVEAMFTNIRVDCND